MYTKDKLNKKFVVAENFPELVSTVALRTFALIVSVHPYCACKFTCHVMHRARMLCTKMNNDRADGHSYSFDWI